MHIFTYTQLVRSLTMHHMGGFRGGARGRCDDMAYATIDPATNAEVRTFPSLSDEEADRAVERAHATFLQWRELSVSERASKVKRAGELMLERKDEFARIVTLEMGKRFVEAQAEVDLSAAILRYYGDNAASFLRQENIDVKNGDAEVLYQPLGVILGVEPWNFPLYQVVRLAAPNLALGNTILIKHASNCPQNALLLAQLFVDAGVPEGAYTNVFIDSKQIRRVIENPLVRGASLTGSEQAGASVGEIAGRNLKKVVLELGGSDPFIVLDAGNIERTIRNAAMGRLANTGQSCIAAKRFIVVDDVYDAFLDGLRAAFAKLKPGDPMDPQTTLGPLSSERAAVELVGQVEEAVGKGASVVVGGGRVNRPGAFVEATILTDVTPEMNVYREELFGPVAVVYKVADDDAAVALANDSPYGLGGAVFCSDAARARKVAERIESGMVWINSPTGSSPELPFGGVKRSGFGRELSSHAITEFANMKLIRTLPAGKGPAAKVVG